MLPERWLRLAVIVLAAGLGPAPAQVQDGQASAGDRAPTGRGGAAVRVDVEAARFSGDFGGAEEITFDVLTTRLRGDWRRGTLRLALPWLRLSSSGVRLVGGVPTPEQDRPSARGTRSVSGPGDVRVRGDLELLTGTATRPWISVLGEVKLPTADEDEGLGTGETDTALGLGLIQPLGRTYLLFEGRRIWMGDPPGVDFDDVVRLGAGLARTVGARGGGSLLIFFENRSHPIPGREDRRDLFAGGTARLGADRRLRLTGGVFAGLSDTAEDWGASVGLGVILP